MQFSVENKKKFDEVLARYPVKRSALLPALHLAQELREHREFAENEAILCKKTDAWTRTLEQLLSK